MARFAEDIPGSFRIITVLAVIWMAFGCMSYVMHVTMTPETIAALPAAQSELMRSTPAWLYGVFAIAVWVGLAGAVMLFMKRRIAVSLLLVSWVAAAIQFGYTYAALNAWSLLGPSGAILPAIIVLLGFFFWNYAKGAAAKGWIR